MRRVPRPCTLRKVDFPRRTSELQLIALPHIFKPPALGVLAPEPRRYLPA
jgi:hypothetical protein